MADNVIALPGGAKPNQRLIDDLEVLLSLARSGTIQGIAYAAARRDRAWITSHPCEIGYNGVLAAGLLVLNHRFAAALLDNPEADLL